MTGGALCILLGLFSAMGLPGFGGRQDVGSGLQPSKIPRPSTATRARAAEEEPGLVTGPIDGFLAGKEAGMERSTDHQTKAAHREQDLQAKTGGSGEPDGGKAAGKASLLRWHLLERAGLLAVHGDDPWKNLVLVALAYHRAGEHAAAEAWFERAKRLAIDPDSTERSSAALRDVMKGWLAISELERASALLQCIPDARYRDLASAELAAAMARKKMFGEAIQLATSLLDPAARARALRGVADAQARYGGVNRALMTVSQITDGKSRDDALMRVALVRAGMGDLAGAENAISRILSARTQDLARVRVAEYAARSGKAGTPETLLAALNDPFLRDESLRRIVEAQVARFKFDEAKASAYRIENRVDRALAMESLVRLQTRSGDYVGALSRARSIDVPASRTRALRTVAVGKTAAAGTVAARSVAYLIDDVRERDVTYRQIAERAAVLGRSREAVEVIHGIEFPEERAAALAAVARTRARRGSLEPARLLIQDAVRVVETIPAQRNQWRAMGMLATAYAEAQDSDAALSMAASIGDAGLRDRAYQQLTRNFASIPDVALAEQSAQAIDRETTRERALADMARRVAGKTRPNEAIGRLKEFDTRSQQVRFLLAVADRI